jgi:chromosome segregation ATPase
MVCKMVKKGLIGTALGAGVLALLFGTAAPSYFKAAIANLRSGAKAAVPIEFDIDRVQQEIASLEPAIQKGIEALAKAEVEAKHLETEIASTQATLTREEQEILSLREHVRTGDVRLTSGVSYTADEVKTDLARRLTYYENLEKILGAKQDELKNRQSQVVSARKQLLAMQAAKRELGSRVEGIRARLNQLKATRATSQVNFDDSSVGRAKQAVSDLERRLEEMARVDELKEKYLDRGISVIVEPKRDVIREIDAKFGGHASDKSAATQPAAEASGSHRSL